MIELTEEIRANTKATIQALRRVHKDDDYIKERMVLAGFSQTSIEEFFPLPKVIVPVAPKIEDAEFELFALIEGLALFLEKELPTLRKFSSATHRDVLDNLENYKLKLEEVRNGARYKAVRL